MTTAALATSDSALAATFTVSSTTDAVDSNIGNGVCLTAGGVCTLRAAIQEANAVAGADTVNLAPATYTLTIAGQLENSAATGDLDITGALTLAGVGSAATIIDGGALDRVIEVRSPGVTITRVMIRNGAVSDDGGGIRLHGSNGLNLSEAALVDNDIGGKKGGGLSASSGALVLTNVTVSGNRAKDAPGIFNLSASITLTNVTIANNTGTGKGAFDPGSGTVSVRNTIIALNVGVADCDSVVGPGANNLDGDGSCGFATTTNPLLGALGDNGGPSYTQALLTGSPAIDNGTNVGAPATDQRGPQRQQRLSSSKRLGETDAPQRGQATNSTFQRTFVACFARDAFTFAVISSDRSESCC